MIRGGFLLIDKPAGPTSNNVLQQIKRVLKGSLGTRVKFGHAGTLDSFASGLLLVLAGNSTRLTPWFMHQTKEYDAVFRFGVETDTLDPLGTITVECDPPTKEQLVSVLPQFEGSIMQVPPQYSAVHSRGERAYRQVMRGEQPDLKARPVMVERCSLQWWDGKSARCSIRCSAGTYVRALARDIGLACGSRAYVEALRRTRIGPFSIEDAVNPSHCTIESLRPYTPDLATALGMRTGLLERDYLRQFLHGARLPKAAVTKDAIGRVDAQDKDLALFLKTAACSEDTAGESVEFVGVLMEQRDYWQVRVMAAEGMD